MGDVIQVGDRFFASASAGWDEVPASELALLVSRVDAALAVREAYDFKPGEPLAIINPIGPVVRHAEIDTTEPPTFSGRRPDHSANHG